MKFISAKKWAGRIENLEVFCTCRTRHKIERSKNIPGGTFTVMHESSIGESTFTNAHSVFSIPPVGSVNSVAIIGFILMNMSQKMSFFIFLSTWLSDKKRQLLVRLSFAFRKDICEKANNFPMCPRCDKGCPFWNLSDTCIYSKVLEVEIVFFSSLLRVLTKPLAT